ncbi:predicted protein [Nematostella vectensis]|uniref:SAM domain-containing protein n=2 Tax=Nematostella vectensis TaxID=45351 RepID=A7SEN6_NEMVE|nr:predicted protein [Nematostella vectensis]|eukprot:XP_001629910.1 predicted protein [Nematostella vectensis]
MVADVNVFQDQLGRGKKPSVTPNRILTHVVEGFVIQESNFPFTADDDDDDYDPLRNRSHDQNGDIEMDMEGEESPLSNDESFDNVFLETSSVPGHCEQCGCATEVHHQRGPRRFCSTSCARRYSVSCSRKMLAYRARMKNARNRHHISNRSATGTSSHRKNVQTSPQPPTQVYEPSYGIPSVANACVQVNEFDHMSTCYDWSRNEVEPLWLYEHVEAAKWSIDQVADFIRSLQGCSEHADSFIAEEIDGQALMLLREEHMVVAMKMKLGPALKIVAKVDTMKREAMLREHGTD